MLKTKSILYNCTYFLFALLIASSCDDDNAFVASGEQEDNIILFIPAGDTLDLNLEEILQKETKWSSVLSMIYSLDEEDTIRLWLTDTIQNTLFLPTNVALQNFIKEDYRYDSLGALTYLGTKDFINTMVINSLINVSNLKDNATFNSLNREAYTLNRDEVTMTINDFATISSYISGTNAVIYEVDKVIKPKAYNLNLMLKVLSNQNQSSFVTVINQFDSIRNMLIKEKATLTVFSPTEKAFKNFLKRKGYSEITSLTKEMMLDICLNHIVTDTVLPSRHFSSKPSPSNLKGGEITIDAYLANGTVIGPLQRDKYARNGVMHLVDSIWVQ